MEPEVIGAAPSLANQVCEELLCEQYWHNGSLSAPFNVIYLKFGLVWHRLTFDSGIIFWRQQTERPTPYTMPELSAETRIDNLGERTGLRGQRLVSYIAHALDDGSGVVFSFEGDRTLVFRNIADQTSCVI